MSGPAALLATVGALYFLECIVAVPGGFVAFRGTARASWRRVGAGLQVGTHGKQIVLLPLLPWMQGAVLASTYGGSLDADAARGRMAAWKRATAALRVDAVGMFALVFVLAPLAVRLFGWDASWPTITLGVLSLALLVVGDFRAAWDALHPGSRAPLGVLATIAVSPASAMRAPDVLLREQLVGIHSLAAAYVLCETDEYERAASEWMRARRRMDVLAQRSARSDWSGDAEAERRLWASVEGFISRTVQDPERLGAPPERRDPDARSYCPSCFAQYVIASGSCGDCGGIALAPYEGSSEAAATDRQLAAGSWSAGS